MMRRHRCWPPEARHHVAGFIHEHVKVSYPVAKSEHKLMLEAVELYLMDLGENHRRGPARSSETHGRPLSREWFTKKSHHELSPGQGRELTERKTGKVPLQEGKCIRKVPRSGVVRWITEATPKTVSLETVQHGSNVIKCGDPQINRMVQHPRSGNWQSPYYVTTASFGGEDMGSPACASGSCADEDLKVTTSTMLPALTCLATGAGGREWLEGKKAQKLGEVAWAGGANEKSS